MSTPTVSVYGKAPLGGSEGRMEIDRRTLLASAVGLFLTGTLRSTSYAEVCFPDAHGWHPLTDELLSRARRANSADGRSNITSIERLIHDVAQAQGCTKSPVIKWLADPSCAFDRLNRYSLDELLRMGTASLWTSAGPSAHFDDRSLDLSLVLGEVVADMVGAAEHDRALMAPKLLSKRRATAGSASAEAIFRVRAVAAQIGWLETCMPVTAAQAVTNIELFLSSGVSEDDEPIHHQLRVFEAYELGLLATWETPGAVICVPRLTKV